MEGKSTDWVRGPSGPTVCRCCFAEGCYKDISTEYFWMGKKEVYCEMLTETFDLSIAFAQTSGPNSNSRLICEPCISRLRDASEFKKQVQECEKMFMQYLDPGRSTVEEIQLEITQEPMEKGVKLEPVKLEKNQSDDDFDDRGGFEDMDEDDLDDQPLTKLASKVPKKESVDLLDLLDNAKAEKRKSSTKAKASPAKKAKTKKETPKATVSKPKPEKKKKDNDAYLNAKRNAEIIVRYSTAYPFRLPESSMVCVYCCESYDDPTLYRKHMVDDHQTFKVRTAFVHCSEGYIKADCTELHCRLCSQPFDTLEAIASHIHLEHDKKLNLNSELGIQPFKLEKDKLLCAMCNAKFPCIRQLSRHTQSHFLKYTCDTCGKSYATITTLKNHIRFSHAGNERICRKCRMTFSTLEAKREHLRISSKCWSHLCMFCGERFMTWTLKQMHLNQVHSAPKKSHSCPECGEVFSERKKYRVHFKISHTDDNFMCTCCGLKFDTKRGLEEHRVVHTKEKLFPCSVCSKSFPRKKNLAQHMWIHSEYKRFECGPCNKQFNQRVSWRTHMKSYHPDLVDFEGKTNVHSDVKVRSISLITDPKNT
ncbi:gastrula zinc finger protein XlCGF26.1-like isoform X14 [Leguminivora glycinivorella]|uniref:gastrula zinc finger protein XlCGF26.1-like isoform X14 n=1 Tax=Leguminivora glycinivorella TaxID=1035111 RepID=UPI00200D21F6|nr:gastrula zinc finger protein XlCGF26.1-like isoform X14 [Leguminivora glycinivorella]